MNILYTGMSEEYEGDLGVEECQITYVLVDTILWSIEFVTVGKEKLVL